MALVAAAEAQRVQGLPSMQHVLARPGGRALKKTGQTRIQRQEKAKGVGKKANPENA